MTSEVIVYKLVRNIEKFNQLNEKSKSIKSRESPKSIDTQPEKQKEDSKETPRKTKEPKTKEEGSSKNSSFEDNESSEKRSENPIERDSESGSPGESEEGFSGNEESEKEEENCSNSYLYQKLCDLPQCEEEDCRNVRKYFEKQLKKTEASFLNACLENRHLKNIIKSLLAFNPSASFQHIGTRLQIFVYSLVFEII
jgi:hypothetical protein